MIKKLFLFLFLTSLVVMVFAQRHQKSEEPSFVATEIPDSVWQQMQGKSYHPNTVIQRGHLRYLKVAHWGFDGKTHIGELICHSSIAQDLLGIFRSLYEAKYPIQQIALPDVYGADDERQMRANNTSCFCYRPIAGSTKLSKHARGLAIDLNPLYNPYYKVRKDGKVIVQPATAQAYTDRTKKFPYKIDRRDLAYRLFIQHGFHWGGDWKYSKDYQHFEK